MTKQLFVREITYRAYVYMDPDETRPYEFDDEIVSNKQNCDDHLLPVDPGENPLGWDPYWPIYHDSDGDLTLNEVLS